MPKNSFVPSYYNANDSSLTSAQLATQTLNQQASAANSVDNLVNGRSAVGGRRRSNRRSSRKQNSRRQNRSRRGSRKSRRQQNNRRNQRGGGRTFDVPMPSDPFKMPGPTFNNAWYTGEACNGPHCGVAVTPFVTEYIHNNLTNGNVPPPGATTQYPVIDRLGNSLGEDFPGIQPYTGTEMNPGPFNFNCVSGGARRQRRNSRKQNRSRQQKRKSRGRRN